MIFDTLSSILSVLFTRITGSSAASANDCGGAGVVEAFTPVPLLGPADDDRGVRATLSALRFLVVSRAVAALRCAVVARTADATVAACGRLPPLGRRWLLQMQPANMMLSTAAELRTTSQQGKSKSKPSTPPASLPPRSSDPSQWVICSMDDIPKVVRDALECVWLALVGMGHLNPTVAWANQEVGAATSPAESRVDDLVDALFSQSSPPVNNVAWSLLPWGRYAAALTLKHIGGGQELLQCWLKGAGATSDEGTSPPQRKRSVPPTFPQSLLQSVVAAVAGAASDTSGDSAPVLCAIDLVTFCAQFLSASLDRILKVGSQPPQHDAGGTHQVAPHDDDEVRVHGDALALLDAALCDLSSSAQLSILATLQPPTEGVAGSSWLRHWAHLQQRLCVLLEVNARVEAHASVRHETISQEREQQTLHERQVAAKRSADAVEQMTVNMRRLREELVEQRRMQVLKSTDLRARRQAAEEKLAAALARIDYERAERKRRLGAAIAASQVAQQLAAATMSSHQHRAATLQRYGWCLGRQCLQYLVSGGARLTRSRASAMAYRLVSLSRPAAEVLDEALQRAETEVQRAAGVPSTAASVSFDEYRSALSDVWSVAVTELCDYLLFGVWRNVPVLPASSSSLLDDAAALVSGPPGTGVPGGFWSDVIALADASESRSVSGVSPSSDTTIHFSGPTWKRFLPLMELFDYSKWDSGAPFVFDGTASTAGATTDASQGAPAAVPWEGARALLEEDEFAVDRLRSLGWPGGAREIIDDAIRLQLVVVVSAKRPATSLSIPPATLSDRLLGDRVRLLKPTFLGVEAFCLRAIWSRCFAERTRQRRARCLLQLQRTQRENRPGDRSNSDDDDDPDAYDDSGLAAALGDDDDDGEEATAARPARGDVWSEDRAVAQQPSAIDFGLEWAAWQQGQPSTAVAWFSDCV